MRAHTEAENRQLDVAVVMPAYNEEACISRVVEDWRSTLQSLGVEFRIIVLDDGSTDGTASRLHADEWIDVVSKPNEGHGPTILRGYASAAALAAWVFQVDADDEIAADNFRTLWDQRDRYDALIGLRQDRQQRGPRRALSAASRCVVRALYGNRVRDVNAPFRLIRSAVLSPILEVIPPMTFAPNLLISGALSRSSVRVANVPVPHVNRRTGAVSIVRLRLLAAAWKSFMQTIAALPSIKKVAGMLRSDVVETSG